MPTASRSLRMTPKMMRYYKRWISSPKVLGQPLDDDKFYQFVKACVRYGKRIRRGAWLRRFLKRDLPKRFPKDYCRHLINDAVSKFDCIMEYEDVEFPDPLVELKNPTSVRCAMERLRFSDKDINEYIERNFKGKNNSFRR